jgi:hypothetical protein
LAHRLNRIGDDPQKRAVERARCYQDCVYWINTHCYTYDPREAQAVVPFDLFPKQIEFINWIKERERLQQDGILEKSRDMGASWLCCAYALHGWLFKSGYQVGFGSRKLEYVDERGDPKSIFEKLRLLHTRRSRLGSGAGAGREGRRRWGGG